MSASPVYSERLGVPLRWWVQGTMLVATLWLAVVVALPAVAAWVVTAIALAILAALLLGYGAARIEIADGDFRAGRAHIAAAHLGTAVPLDAEQTRRTAGRDADVRAFLLLRPYLKRAVKVEITDPADPAPYWLVSTRRPEELALALTALTDRPPTAQTEPSTAGYGAAMASGGSKVWTVFSLAAALGAAAVAKKVMDKSWTVATGKKPPENPADPDVEIWEAVLWAGISGTAVGLARMLAQRRAASYYTRSTGHLPPELAKDDQDA